MVMWSSVGVGVGFPTPTSREKPHRGKELLTAADPTRELRGSEEPAVVSNLRYEPPKEPLRPKVVVHQSDLRDDDFQRLGVLGEGSYSVVVAARHLPSREVVALKELSRRKLRDLELETQLQWEINLHRTLRHPNIVRLLSYYITGRSVVLVLELCRGGSLLKKLLQTSDRRFDELRAARYIRHVAQALAYLHEHGIVHRDLKPENILIDSKGVARLADFGWSKGLTGSAAAGAVVARGRDASEVPKHTAANEVDNRDEREDGPGRLTVCGTLDYMSPELLGGTPYSYKSDMWSLGALLVEMLSGRPPFYHASQRETLQAIRNECPQLGADGILSPLASELALKLLQKDPNMRPTAAEVLQHPWLRDKRPRS